MFEINKDTVLASAVEAAKAPTVKCPKGKAVFQATTPDGRNVTRSSARNYTHALAVYRAERLPEWYASTHLIGDTNGPVMTAADAPEGAYDIEPTEYKSLRYADGSPMLRYKMDQMTKGSPAGWGIYSFNGSAELAAKGASQWNLGAGDRYEVVPVTVLADRRTTA